MTEFHGLSPIERLRDEEIGPTHESVLPIPDLDEAPPVKISVHYDSDPVSGELRMTRRFVRQTVIINHDTGHIDFGSWNIDPNRVSPN